LVPWITLPYGVAAPSMQRPSNMSFVPSAKVYSIP